MKATVSFRHVRRWGTVVPVAGWRALLGLLLLASPQLVADDALLNASYDVTREFYKEFNEAFARHWQETTGHKVTIDQSHGGSSKQARAVIDGLEADVVTMNQALDIDMLFEKGGLVPKNWAERLPNNSAPYTSTILILVRKGNPKLIRDWSDLIRPGVSVVVPNPKTSGNGRYSYLAAWSYALQLPGGSDDKARAFVTSLFKNVPVLDTGGRGATTTFVQRGIGDVLLTFESEVQAIRQEFGSANLEVVVPSVSILAENPVTWVDRVVAKHKSTQVAQAYLKYLWSEPGQEIAARHHFRPRLPEVQARHQAGFPTLELRTVDAVFGSWAAAQKRHFNDGGIFDQIYHP